MPVYFKLTCYTCKEAFEPLRATSPGELLSPDYEDEYSGAGTNNLESLRSFHEKHRGHALEALEDRDAA